MKANPSVPNQQTSQELTDEQKHELIKQHLPLARSFVRRYAKTKEQSQQYMGAAVLGLAQAAEGYQASKGAQFSTYARWWLRRAITRAMVSDRCSVSVPYWKTEIWFTAKRAGWRSEGDEASQYDQFVRKDFNDSELCDIESAVNGQVSMDNSYTQGEEPFSSFFADESTVAADDIAQKTETEEILTDALERLSEREQQVIIMRYGLHGTEPHTLREVGSNLGISRQRVQQIANRALERLREEIGTCELTG